MTDLNNARYYSYRERIERERADQIGDPLLAGIHREMAEMYRARAVEEAEIDQPNRSLSANYR